MFVPFLFSISIFYFIPKREESDKEMMKLMVINFASRLSQQAKRMHDFYDQGMIEQLGLGLSRLHYTYNPDVLRPEVVAKQPPNQRRSHIVRALLKSKGLRASQERLMRRIDEVRPLLEMFVDFSTDVQEQSAYKVRIVQYADDTR